MKRINKKVILLAVSLLLILSAAIGGTVAYLIDQTGSITNTFTPVKVTPGINENFDRSVKNDVQITNTGDIPAYIRVKVVVTWKDKDDNVYGAAPAPGTDYTWQIPGTDWVKDSDGFYYYTKPVPAGEKTSVLLTACQPVAGRAPAGYSLSVDIHAQAIQAEPTTAVTSAWNNVTAVGTDGALTVKQ